MSPTQPDFVTSVPDVHIEKSLSVTILCTNNIWEAFIVFVQCIYLVQ